MFLAVALGIASSMDCLLLGQTLVVGMVVGDVGSSSIAVAIMACGAGANVYVALLLSMGSGDPESRVSCTVPCFSFKRVLGLQLTQWNVSIIVSALCSGFAAF